MTLQPRLLLFGIALATIGLVVPVGASAQGDPNLDRSRMSSAAFYNYAEPGEITVLAQVLGTVRFPGLYTLARGTRFSELLALAGGPAITERPRQNKRTVAIRLYRLRGDDRVLIKESVGAEVLDPSGGDPEIAAGDIVLVESVVRQGVTWRDIFPIVGAVASVTLIVERLLN